MIRPFGITNIPQVWDLQRSSAVLAIEHALTHPQEPLWIALTAPWPWAGVGVATYVLDARGENEPMAGFVQLMKRTARPEADLLYLAPALPTASTSNAVGEEIWRRLLAHGCLAAAGHGLQRVFASIRDHGPEPACLKEAGFSLYTRETIYRLATAPPASEQLTGFRPQLPQDSWALQRLYTRSTPRLVQSAEGAMTGEVGSPPLSWWEPDRWQGVVWEPAGEVRGVVQVHIGRAGHWLRIWGTNMLAARELRALIDQGLRSIATTRSRGARKPLPVYATVRDYEIGLSGALTGLGFAPYVDRARSVKHTPPAVRESLPATLPALDGRQEVPVRSQPHRP
ncbi:MAG: hypothetical protein CVU38_01475 [Chloroflexi bacterium HGW-Chloroflexi-1]|nr:MAG: hypothetical protein CVU38_01475 [Chloroflexi bacterium HGW-Chloroflexi-1]